jgi:hypothetical protein
VADAPAAPRRTTAEATDAQAAPRPRSTTTTTIASSDDAREFTYRARDAGTQATSEEELDARPGGTLELDLETGGAVAIQAWDRAKVSVQTKLAGRDWSGTRVSAERTGTGVRVHAWQQAPHGSFSTSHAFAINVPARYDVRIRSAGGDVAIVGLEGTIRGITGGGNILLERDSGRAWLTTGGGAIAVNDCELDGRVSTGGGAVQIERTRGSLVGSSGSGIVRSAEGDDLDESGSGNGDEAPDGSGDGSQVAEPRGSSRAPVAGGPGFVRVNKAGGSVDLEEAPHGANVTTGGGDVHIGPAAGTVAVSTGGGSIDVGPVAGSVWAGTGAGSVTVRLADRHGEEQVVDISSGTGKVVLELPRDLDARFELETAYTDNLGHATHIESAWDLEQTRTQAWDDTHGTPRRYVRARGVFGGGRGLIRVRTVNGDIEVRRAR